MSYLCADRFSAYNGLTVTATATRSSGLLPLAVTFDATATTDISTSNPFRDLQYTWDFDDPGSGTFTNGRETGLSTNSASGAVAGHVYESAGTYTPTVTVFNGLVSKVYTLPDIVVSAWADDANTVCVGNILPVQGVGGVPSNATVVMSSDFDSAISGNFGTGKRVLFNKGDTFVASVLSALSAAGPNMIGAYGTGALPIVTSTNIAGVLNPSNSAVNDLRICDLDIRGNGATDTGTAVLVSADISGVLIKGNTISEFGKGLVCSGTNGITGSIIQENTITNIYAHSGGVGFFGKAATSAFLGNSVGPIDTAAEHLIRIQPAQKTAVCSNTLNTPSDEGKLCLAIRAQDHTTGSAPDPVNDAQYVYIADNTMKYLRGGAVGANCLQIAPASNGQNDWISDVVAERNLLVNFPTAATSCTTIIVSASRVTIRNNLFNFTGAATFDLTGVSVFYTNTAGSPVPDDVQILGNSIYSADADASKTAVGIDIDTEPTGTSIINNLMYMPTASACAVINGTGTSHGTFSTNSSNAQAKATDPFVNHTAFAPTGYALASGTVIDNFDDYDNAQRSYGNKQPSIDMGAVQTTVN